MGGKNSKDKTPVSSSSSLSFFKFKSKSKLIHKSNKKKLKPSKSATNIPNEQYATPYSNSSPHSPSPPKNSSPNVKVIEYKLYRSYSDLKKAVETEKNSPARKSITNENQTLSNLKVYRKSSGADRFDTLLRDNKQNQLSRSSTLQLSKKTETKTANYYNPLTAAQKRHTCQENLRLSRGRVSSNISLNLSSSFRRTASRISTSSIGYNVSANDMPSVSRVKAKTRQFELSFVRRLSDLIDSIPLERLIQQVVVGVVPLPNGGMVNGGRRQSFFINIENYLLKSKQLEYVMVPLISQEILGQLIETLGNNKNDLENNNNTNLIVNNVDFSSNHISSDTNKCDTHTIKKINDIDITLNKNEFLHNNNNENNLLKKEVHTIYSQTNNNLNSNTTVSIINSKQIKRVLKQIVNSYLMSISKEISRIYEYQIALISDGLSLDLLSRYAADCVIDFLEFPGKSVSIFHTDSAVHSVVWGNPTKSKLGNSTLSILIGEKELKWKIGEILTKPGLRLDSLLYKDEIEITSPEEAPWRFYSHDNCDFLLYGYRGTVIDKFSKADTYRIHLNELSFNAEVNWMDEDFHRCYTPYRKLVGRKVMEMYNKILEEKSTNLHQLSTFSTAIHDISDQRSETSVNDQKDTPILSLMSFVSLLMGDEAGKEEIEVVCRILENEKVVYAHFLNLEEKTKEDYNKINVNSNNQCSDIEMEKIDFSKNTLDESSFNSDDFEYTNQNNVIPCDIDTNQFNHSSPCDRFRIKKINININNDIKNNCQPDSTNSNLEDRKNSLKKETINNLKVREVIKYSLTPVKSVKLVDSDFSIPVKHLDSVELEDLYTQTDTCSFEDFTDATTTTSACFNCEEVSDVMMTSNEDLSEYVSSPNQENLNQSFEHKTYSSFHTSPYVSEHSCQESNCRKSANTTKSSLASDV